MGLLCISERVAGFRTARKIGGEYKMKILLGIIMTAFLLISCSTAYMAYRQDMFDGTNLLRQGEYEKARAYFTKALTEQRDARALAFAATASYKLNDLTAAESYLTEAENIKQPGVSYLRIAGYKALTLLKENKKAEGMQALKEYIDVYGKVHPMGSIETVEKMWKKDKVDMAELEKLIDRHVTTYEYDVAQYIETGTGWYAPLYSPGNQ